MAHDRGVANGAKVNPNTKESSDPYGVSQEEQHKKDIQEGLDTIEAANPTGAKDGFATADEIENTIKSGKFDDNEKKKTLWTGVLNMMRSDHKHNTKYANETTQKSADGKTEYQGVTVDGLLNSEKNNNVNYDSMGKPGIIPEDKTY